MHNVPNSTWIEYKQIQALLTQHWLEQNKMQNDFFSEKKNNENDDFENNDNFSENKNQGFAFSGIATSAVIAAGKAVFDAAIHNGPDVIKWFEEHHKKVSAPKAPNITWKEIELKIMKCGQIIIPLTLGGIAIYEYVNPTSNSTQIITIVGLALNFLATYRGNTVAKNITDIEKQYASSAGLNLGLAAAQPALVSESSVPDSFSRNFDIQEEENQRATCCEIPIPCLSSCSSQPEEKQRTWTQCFTDPSGCLPVWLRCSGKEKNDTEEKKNTEITDL